MREPPPRAREQPDVLAVGNDAVPLGQEVAHDDAEPEHGQRDPDQRDHRDEDVDDASGSERRERAHRDSEQQPDDARTDRQRERRRRTGHDLLHDVLLARVRDERARHHALHQPRVLHGQRPVEAPRVSHVLDALRGRVLARDPLCRIAAGDDDEDHEHDDAERDEHDHGSGETACEIEQHQRSGV